MWFVQLERVVFSIQGSVIEWGFYGESAALQDVGVYHGGFYVFVSE
jgi:hypothetical protein